MIDDPNCENYSVLVGRYFLSYEDKNGHNVVRWQGRIIEKISDKYYLVQVSAGTEDNQYVVTLEEMLGWHFCERDKDMGESSKHSLSGLPLHAPPEVVT